MEFRPQTRALEMTQAEGLQGVIQGIEEAIRRFPEIWNPTARIAFSGGKDSIALAHALAVAGRPTGLRAVDMGYNPMWRGRIETIARTLSLPLEIVTASTLVKDDTVAPEVRRDLALRRAFLDKLTAADSTVTPCTNCYNCKIISLVHADDSATQTILFAHHAQDALSSFIKSAIMYIDRWKEGRPVFNRDAFRHIGFEIANDLRSGKQSTVDFIASLLAEGKAHTSEPPIERKTLHGSAYVIARPLFFVDESATAALAKAVVAQPESSGCGHTMAATTRTPREIVHHELIPLVSETAAGRESLRTLLRLLADSFAPDGTAFVDVRGSRHVLLGPDYKGSPADLGDRL